MNLVYASCPVNYGQHHSGGTGSRKRGKEVAVVSVSASVMIYDDSVKKWLPSGSSGSPGLAKVGIYQHSQHNTFRIVGRKVPDHEVVVNSAIVRGIKYHQATPTFHQWKDQRQVYGLNFTSADEANSFATAMIRAIEIASTIHHHHQQQQQSGSRGSSSSSINSQHQHPSQQQTPQGPHQNGGIGVSTNGYANIEDEIDATYAASSVTTVTQRRVSQSSTGSGNMLASATTQYASTNNVIYSSMGGPPSSASQSPGALTPTSYGSSSPLRMAPSAPPLSQQQQQPAPTSSAHHNGTSSGGGSQLAPVTGGPAPPPPPPPLPANASAARPKLSIPQPERPPPSAATLAGQPAQPSSNFAQELANANLRLKKVNSKGPEETKDGRTGSIGSIDSSNSSSGVSSGNGSVNSRTAFGGTLDLMSELGNTLKQRKMKLEDAIGVDQSPQKATQDVRRPWDRAGSSGRLDTATESPKTHKKVPSGSSVSSGEDPTNLAGVRALGNGALSASSAPCLSHESMQELLETWKIDILSDVRREINKAKLDIIDAIRQELITSRR